MARYDETESRWLLPVFMRSDDFDDAMADVVDEFGADVSEATRWYSVWNHIDDLGEVALDELASELNILWYDKCASVESKRDIIKNCKHIQAKLGTKWATEQILSIYYTGDTKITEWYEYERTRGDPNHFIIETEYTPTTAAETRRFLAILNKIKRKSAILDKVYAVINIDADAEAGAWMQGVRTDEMQAIQSPTFKVVIMHAEWRGRGHMQTTRIDDMQARRD